MLREEVASNPYALTFFTSLLIFLVGPLCRTQVRQHSCFFATAVLLEKLYNQL